MTLVFAYGTSAELIKYSPVLKMLENHKDVQLWSTSQQGATVIAFEDRYGIKEIKRLSNNPEQSREKRSQVPKWALTVAIRAFKFKKERGRLPEMSSADAWEKKMAEGAAAFVRFKDEGRYD